MGVTWSLFWGADWVAQTPTQMAAGMNQNRLTLESLMGNGPVRVLGEPIWREPGPFRECEGNQVHLESEETTHIMVWL